MSHDEAARHALYDALAKALGPEPTSHLMSLLPPVGWADVATKQDLRIVESELRTDFERLRGEFQDLRGDFHELRADLATSQRQQTMTLVGAMLSISTLTTIAGALL